MFPHIWYESYLMNSIINQSFFIAYEVKKNFDEEEKQEIKIIENDKLFFRYPKNSAGFVINNNFVPNNYLLNPLVEQGEYYKSDSEYVDFLDDCLPEEDKQKLYGYK